MTVTFGISVNKPQPHYLSQVLVHSEQEKQQLKQLRKEGKKNAKLSKNKDEDDDDAYELNPAYLREKRFYIVDFEMCTFALNNGRFLF